MSQLSDLLGLVITWKAPLWTTRVESGTLLEEIAGYSHTLGREGYYIDAQVSLSLPRVELENWVAFGLGRDIKVHDQSGNIVFRGYVDQIDGVLSQLAFKLGPLSEVVNRVYCTYSPQYVLPTQVTSSGQIELPGIQDTSSQALYGIWEDIIDAGKCTINPTTGYNEAAYAQALYLKEFKTPRFDWTTSNSGSVTINLGLKGYYTWFDAYLFQDRISTPTVITMTAHVTAVLAANVNTSVISASTTGIGTNAALVINKTTGYQKAKDELQSVASAGDASNNPWWVYLDEKNKLIYEAVPLTPYYQILVVSKKQLIQEMNNQTVNPWSIKPGKVVFLPDLMLSISGPPRTLGEDIRLGIIDQVRYTSPWDFQISTTRLNKFQRMLDRKGLGGY